MPIILRLLKSLIQMTAFWQYTHSNWHSYFNACPLLVPVRVLHGRLEGDTRHRPLLRPLLPGLHGEGGDNKRTILLLLLLLLLLRWRGRLSSRPSSTAGRRARPGNSATTPDPSSSLPSRAPNIVEWLLTCQPSMWWSYLSKHLMLSVRSLLIVRKMLI